MILYCDCLGFALFFFVFGSTAQLFTMCCSRRLQIREMDPNNEAEVNPDGKLDTLGAFAKGEIVQALRGHPACVEDLCRRVHDDNSLLVRKQTLLDRDIPEVRPFCFIYRSRCCKHDAFFWCVDR